MPEGKNRLRQKSAASEVDGGQAKILAAPKKGPRQVETRQASLLRPKEGHMVLKLFSKTVEQEETTEGPADNQRMEQMESHLRDLGLEVVKLRQEVNTMLARQQTFKIALGRLREYLEERGALEEAAQEIQVPFQELLHENAQEVEATRSAPAARKNKSNLH